MSFSRREALGILAAGALLPLAAPARAAETPPGRITDPDVAWKALLDGNARYVAGQKTGGSGRGLERREATAPRQYPFAALLACADSRTAPEIFYDSGIGDLFVVRVAGNVVNLSDHNVMGSLEFAVAVLGAPLIVVLGHTNCGAMVAAKQTIDGDSELPGSIEAMVDAIRPAARAAKGLPGDPLTNVTDENVRLGVKLLRGSHPILAPRVAEGKIKVAGGVYDLASGKVKVVVEPG